MLCAILSNLKTCKGKTHKVKSRVFSLIKMRVHYNQWWTTTTIYVYIYIQKDEVKKNKTVALLREGLPCDQPPWIWYP